MSKNTFPEPTIKMPKGRTMLAASLAAAALAYSGASSEAHAQGVRNVDCVTTQDDRIKAPDTGFVKRCRVMAGTVLRATASTVTRHHEFTVLGMPMTKDIVSVRKRRYNEQGKYIPGSLVREKTITIAMANDKTYSDPLQIPEANYPDTDYPPTGILPGFPYPGDDEVYPTTPGPDVIEPPYTGPGDALCYDESRPGDPFFDCGPELTEPPEGGPVFDDIPPSMK